MIKNKLPAIDENLQAIFDTGHEFEPYAEARFPGAVQLGFNDYREYLSLPSAHKPSLSRVESKRYSKAASSTKTLPSSVM
jgi:hypothetical protein